IRLGGVDLDAEPVEIYELPEELVELHKRDETAFFASQELSKFLLDQESEMRKNWWPKALRAKVQSIITEEIAEPRRTLVKKPEPKSAKVETKLFAPPAPVVAAPPKVEPPPAPAAADPFHAEFMTTLSDDDKKLPFDKLLKQYDVFRAGRVGAPAAMPPKVEPKPAFRYTAEQGVEAKKAATKAAEDIRELMIDALTDDWLKQTKRQGSRNPDTKKPWTREEAKAEAEKQFKFLVEDKLRKIDQQTEKKS
ncbi:MAG: hypothetical protein AAB692_02560, partial [Patescibacteria group bacterium]